MPNFDVSKHYTVLLPDRNTQTEAYTALVDLFVQLTSEDNSDSIAYMRSPVSFALDLAQFVDEHPSGFTKVDQDTELAEMLVKHGFVVETNWETHDG